MTALDVLAGRVSRGDVLSDEDAEAILATSDLIAIGMMADGLRRGKHGPRVTFGRVFEFHVDAPPAVAPAGMAAGEVRIVGRPSNEEAAIAAVRTGARLAAGAPLTGFSLADLEALAPSSAGLEALCARLREAGLEAVAETPVDLLHDAALAVDTARRGGLAVLRLTVQALAPGRQIAIARQARDLQQAVGGIRAFAPLPRTLSATRPTTGYDDVKQVALARMMVTNIDAMQVDWVLYGPKLAQVALTVGADDVDGVAAVDPGTLGTRRSPLEEIKANIRAAALDPVERNGRFELA